MRIAISNPWFYFCIAFGVMLLATWLMETQGSFLFTKKPLRRKFTVLEMEFPSSGQDLAKLIRGIHLLPNDAKKTVRGLRIQLLIDCILFIPATYGGIFVLCMAISSKMKVPFGSYSFAILAWGQCLSCLLDYVENIYFWILIKQPQLPNPQTNKSFIFLQLLEGFKWGLVLIGTISGFSAITYYWIAGEYSSYLLLYVLIFFLEIGVFILLQWLTKKRQKGK